MLKKYLPYGIILILIPLILVSGTFLFSEKSYSVVSVMLAILACIPFFISFESKKNATRKLVLIAVMIALSVAGRFIFAPIPFFKPITAMVIISAVYLGKDAGFLVGAMTAVISNIYFGQGPWTPFQMFGWGITGFFAGVLSNQILRSKLIMIIYAIISGFTYSFILDFWTTVWTDGTFNISRFIAITATSLPVTLVYAVSNIIFLLLLFKPIGKKIKRVKVKYGL